MKWFLVNKLLTSQPLGTRYNDSRWKEALAEEGRHQCVYCAVSENYMGGLRAFHVEHYKPKSEFPDLTHVMSNLFYVCPICNSFKGDDWPCEPCEQHSVAAYPNPSCVDYNDIFELNDHDFKAVGRNSAGRYMITRLYLNRPQLVLLRRWTAFKARHDRLSAEVSALRRIIAVKMPSQAVSVIVNLGELQDQLQLLRNRIETARTYDTADITKLP